MLARIVFPVTGVLLSSGSLQARSDTAAGPAGTLAGVWYGGCDVAYQMTIMVTPDPARYRGHYEGALMQQGASK